MLLLPDLNPDCSKTREEGHFVESKGLRRVNDFFFDARSSQLRLGGSYIANEGSNLTLAWAGTLVPEKIEIVIEVSSCK